MGMYLFCRGAASGSLRRHRAISAEPPSGTICWQYTKVGIWRNLINSIRDSPGLRGYFSGNSDKEHFPFYRRHCGLWKVMRWLLKQRCPIRGAVEYLNLIWEYEHCCFPINSILITKLISVHIKTTIPIFITWVIIW